MHGEKKAEHQREREKEDPWTPHSVSGFAWFPRPGCDSVLGFCEMCRFSKKVSLLLKTVTVCSCHLPQTSELIFCNKNNTKKCSKHLPSCPSQKHVNRSGGEMVSVKCTDVPWISGEHGQSDSHTDWIQKETHRLLQL